MEPEFFAALAAELAARRPAVLATLIVARGSTPQGVGAKAAFCADGTVLGTIGGGCLEHDVRRRALDLLRKGGADLVEIDLTHEYEEDTGLICGGRAEVVVCRLELVQQELVARLAAARADRRPAALGTVVAAGELPLGALAAVTENGDASGPSALVTALGQALAERRGGLREAAGGRVYCDLFLPPPRLLIAGAGHVGRALARCAGEVGFQVWVVDERPDLNRAEHIPWASEHVVGDIEGALAALELGPADYVVIVTRGHRHDAAALRAVLRRGAAYVGLIGSRRKIKLIGEGLLAEGAATPAELARVYAPIGLDLGAQSPAEIAVSITAELIAVRHGRLADPARRGWPGRPPAESP